ncbi:MAG TPA: PAS domain-containing protein, partial [Opitutaceae bacterium]
MEIGLIALLLIAAALAAGWSMERRRHAADEEKYRREVAEQRSRRDAELREQSLRTSALFDRMVEGLIVVDAGGRIRLANRASEVLFGFDGRAPGKTILEATRHHEVAAVVARLDREPEVLGYELRIDFAAGPRFLQVNALALRDAGGASDGAILVFHDLTRLRQL